MLPEWNEIGLSIRVLVFMAHILHLFFFFISLLGLPLFQIISLNCLSWFLIQWQTSQYHMTASQEYKTQCHQNCLYFPTSKLFICVCPPLFCLSSYKGPQDRFSRQNLGSCLSSNLLLELCLASPSHEESKRLVNWNREHRNRSPVNTGT